jgi:hypothetical protein
VLSRSAHNCGENDRPLSPEDGIGSAVEVVEEVLDSGAGVKWLVAVVLRLWSGQYTVHSPVILV